MQFEYELQNKTEFLFGRDYLKELQPDDDSVTEEMEEEYEQTANYLISKFGWDAVFSCWNNYLHTKCDSSEKAVNFAHLFWTYGGQEYIIPNPHKFLAFFYYRLNLEPTKYDAVDIMDSLSTTILTKSGFSEADLSLNPHYIPESDPKIIAEIEKYKHAEEGFKE